MSRHRGPFLLLLGFACLAAPAGARAAVQLAQIGTFTMPVFVAAPPGDASRVFVVEQGGTIRVVHNGTVLPQPFLDISTRITSGGERGLLSMAFAADYATSGTVYIYFTGRAGATADHDGDVVIARVHATSPDSAYAPTLEPLLRIPHDQQANHNGGQLQLGPDGNLWAGTGDGGSGGDPAGNGQNLTSRSPATVGGVNHDPLLGKLLRLTPTEQGYAAPADNPFAAPAREVFAYGLRNPFRFSFDRQTGDLTIGDVGQSLYEEIDFAPAPGRGLGNDWGWNVYEGNHPFQGVPNPGTTYSFPVIEHTHSDGWCSIIGGYVVRDPALPELAGQYVYGDYCLGKLWAAKLAAAGATGDHDLGLPKVSNLSSFGEDACGRVYATSLDGPVYRFSSSGECVLPGGGTTPPPGAGADRTPPHMVIRYAARQRALRLNRVRLHVRCDEQCRVTASGRIRSLRLRTARTTIAAGATVTVDLRMSRAVRRSLARALRRGRRVTAVVTVSARDAAGNTARRVVRVRVVPASR